VGRASPSIVDAKKGNLVDKLRSILTRWHLIGIARFIDRSAKELFYAVVNLLRSLRRAPFIGHRIELVLGRLDRYDLLHFDQMELIRVCRSLNDGNIPYWLAGGWGLDALVGCETRRHGDLDFVLDRYSDNLARVNTILESLGYHRQLPLGGTMWFPDAEVYDDDRGHHIEILNINWELLTTAGGLLSPSQSRVHETTAETKLATAAMVSRLTTIGALDGVELPTLSLTAQKLFHLGYERREEDTHAEDTIELISASASWCGSSNRVAMSSTKQKSSQPSTLLLVPIFSLPRDLWRLCQLYHNDLDVMPPHVTLAFPFLPLESVTTGVVQRLSELFAATSAFDFEMNQVRWFDTNVVYLEPSESGAFRSIIETLKSEFPAFHPYDGAFDSVVPHVTLSEHGSLANRRALGRQAPKYLPISARASHVWIMSNERNRDSWSIRKVFALSSATSKRDVINRDDER
jgi:2'-5' RNA ligase